MTTLSWIFRTFESFFERNPYVGCTHCAWTTQGFWVAGAFRTSPVEKSELSHATPVDVGFLSQWIGSRENRSGNHGFYQHFQFWYTQCIIWLVVSPPSKQMSNMGKSKDGEYPQTTILMRKKHEKPWIIHKQISRKTLPMLGTPHNLISG